MQNIIYTLPSEDKMFSGISIETRSDCNLKCRFCPQSIKLRPKMIMQEELFKKIIDELAEMKFSGRICPTTNNEPLLDDRMVSFVAYARQKCPLSFLQLVTNGRLLTEELLFDLFAAGLDNMIINDYREDRSEYPFRLSAQLGKIAELEKKMYQKKIHIAFRSAFELPGEVTNRAGNIRGKGEAAILNQFCALPFIRVWVQAEGKVYLCCQDYNYDEIMGDIRENSFSEIWSGDKYKRIRAELNEKDRSGKVCEKCDYSGRPFAVRKE